MKIALLVIGSEVLDGKISDANTRQLADYLRDHHLSVNMSITVRDESQAIQQGLSTLFKDHDIIITSGGLGPTKDDLTKEAIAQFLGRTISYSEAAHFVAQRNYEKFKREFPGEEHGYCHLPERFEALSNSTGFAPALYTEHAGKLLFCGPGVPKEFKSLLQDHFIQKISGKFPPVGFIETFTVRTKRIPEEKIFGEVDKKLWDKLSIYGEVSSLPNIMGVDVGVKIVATSKEELNRKTDEVKKIFITSPLFPNIWQFGRKPIEEVIVSLANKKNISYGFAESATGGLCSHRITNISGSSQTFLGSVVCYAEEVKEKIINVSAETLQQYTAVSAQASEEMACGLAKNLNLDIAISITGYAGPGAGADGTPAGTVYITSYAKGKVTSSHYQFFGDREQLKNRFAQAAFYLLLEELEKIA